MQFRTTTIAGHYEIVLRPKYIFLPAPAYLVTTEEAREMATAIKRRGLAKSSALWIDLRPNAWGPLAYRLGYATAGDFRSLRSPWFEDVRACDMLAEHIDLVLSTREVWGAA